MLDPVLKKIKKSRTVLAINITLANEGWEISAVFAKSTKGILQIVDKLKLDSINQVPLEYLKTAEVLLNIDGKGIISKKISKDEEPDGIKAKSKAFPDIEGNKFYIQSLEYVNHYYISIFRHDELMKVMEEFRQQGIFLSGITLGPFVLFSIAPLVEGPGSFFVGGYLFTKEDDLVIDMEITKTGSTSDISINEEVINYEYQLPYGLAVERFLDNLSFTSSNADFLEADRSEYLNRWFFERHFKFILGGFLGLLLINLFFYLFFYSENQKLKEAYLPYSGAIKEYEHLRSRFNEQHAVVQRLNWGDNQKYAFYADRLASSLPKEIMWRDFWINPLNEKVLRTERKEAFTNREIVVAGITENPESLNNWLETVNGEDWVLDIYDQNYEYDRRENRGTFVVKIRF